EVVRSIFPETTIVRPAPAFGYEDRLLNSLATMKTAFTVNHMHQRFRPVHAIDIGAALEVMLTDDLTAGQTYELYGPTEYSMAEIAEIVDKEIIQTRSHYNVPASIMNPVAGVLNKALW